MWICLPAGEQAWNDLKNSLIFLFRRNLERVLNNSGSLVRKAPSETLASPGVLRSLSLVLAHLTPFGSVPARPREVLREPSAPSFRRRLFNTLLSFLEKYIMIQILGNTLKFRKKEARK